MCDSGRLNYKWINREDRLTEITVGQASSLSPSKEKPETGRMPVLKTTWSATLREISGLLNKAPQGSVAIIASARQTNEELFLLKKLATRLGATTDSIPRTGEGDKLLLSADRNPNSNGARLIGICSEKMGERIPAIAKGIEHGRSEERRVGKE